MKTHELAKSLKILASYLQKGPNVDLRELAPILGAKSSRAVSDDSLALSSLVAFSRFSKPEWAALIKEHDLPIQIRPSYSSRDVMGKIMGYFAENQDARMRLVERAEKQSSSASPELMNALATLLKS